MMGHEEQKSGRVESLSLNQNGKSEEHIATDVSLLGSLLTAGKTSSLSDPPETMQEALSSVLDGMVEPYIVLNRNSNILFANTSAQKLLKKTSTDLLNKNFHIFSESIGQQAYDTIQKAIKEKRSVSVESFVPSRKRLFEIQVYPSNNGIVIYFKDITEQEKQKKELRETQEQLAVDLAGMTRLYNLNERLLQAANLSGMLQEILIEACDITGTNKGNIQLLSPDGKRLEITVYQGHSEAFLEHFRFDGAKAICGAAMNARMRVIIEDVTKDAALNESDDLKVLLADGIHAVQSTPLISRQGKLVGMLNTHFPKPHRPSLNEYRQLDFLAWMAADFIEHAQQRAELRLKEERTRTLYKLTASLLPLLSFDEVVKTLIDQITSAIGATTGAFNLIEDENTIAVAYTKGSKLPENERKNWKRYTLDIGFPTKDVIERREAVWLEDGADASKRYPAMAPFSKIYSGAWIMLPLIIQDEVIGSLGFAFEEKRVFTQDERDFVTSVVQQGTIALERARLYEAEKQARQTV